MRGKWLTLCAIAVATLAAGRAGAQSTLGYGSAIVIPLVAHTVSFDTEVFLHSPLSAAPLTVDVTLVEGTTSAAPGPKSCGQVIIPASGSASFGIATQCALGAGGHFGYLVVQDSSAEAVNSFYAFSRTQNPQAMGFSVEGFPAGGLSAQSQRANGLKRTTSGVPYQTNCFVASFEKPVDYFIRLKDSTGTNIGTGVSGHLDPHQLVRYLDIFAAAGLAGDFSNVSAQIVTVNASTAGNRDHPLYLSFCTVQDNLSFAADFRIAKSFTAFDATHTQDAGGCTPAPGDCGAYDYAIADTAKKQVFQVFIRPPDHIKCELLSDRLPDLGLQLRQPRSLGDCDLCGLPPGSTAVPVFPGPVVAGGFDQTSFYYGTGPDLIRPGDGAELRDIWTIEVSARGAPVAPIPYSLTCKSGNGIAPVAPFEANDDF